AGLGGQERVEPAGTDGPELERLAGARLREPPDLRVLERRVLAWLDLVHHVRPAGGGEDLVQDGSRLVVGKVPSDPWVISAQSAPSLERIAEPLVTADV